MAANCVQRSKVKEVGKLVNTFASVGIHASVDIHVSIHCVLTFQKKNAQGQENKREASTGENRVKRREKTHATGPSGNSDGALCAK